MKLKNVFACGINCSSDKKLKDETLLPYDSWDNCLEVEDAGLQHLFMEENQELPRGDHITYRKVEDKVFQLDTETEFSEGCTDNGSVIGTMGSAVTTSASEASTVSKKKPHRRQVRRSKSESLLHRSARLDGDTRSLSRYQGNFMERPTVQSGPHCIDNEQYLCRCTSDQLQCFEQTSVYHSVNYVGQNSNCTAAETSFRNHEAIPSDEELPRIEVSRRSISQDNLPALGLQNVDIVTVQQDVHMRYATNEPCLDTIFESSEHGDSEKLAEDGIYCSDTNLWPSLIDAIPFLQPDQNEISNGSIGLMYPQLAKMPRLKEGIPSQLPPGAIPVETVIGLNGETILLSNGCPIKVDFNTGGVQFPPSASLSSSTQSSASQRSIPQSSTGRQTTRTAVRSGESTSKSHSSNRSTSRTPSKPPASSVKENVQDRIKNYQKTIKTSMEESKKGSSSSRTSKVPPGKQGESNKHGKSKISVPNRPAVPVVNWNTHLSTKNVGEMLTICTPTVESLYKIVVALKTQSDDLETEEATPQTNKEKIVSKLGNAMMAFKAGFHQMEQTLLEKSAQSTITVTLSSSEDEDGVQKASQPKVTNQKRDPNSANQSERKVTNQKNDSNSMNQSDKTASSFKSQGKELKTVAKSNEISVHDEPQALQDSANGTASSRLETEEDTLPDVSEDKSDSLLTDKAKDERKGKSDSVDESKSKHSESKKRKSSENEDRVQQQVSLSASDNKLEEETTTGTRTAKTKSRKTSKDPKVGLFDSLLDDLKEREGSDLEKDKSVSRRKEHEASKGATAKSGRSKLSLNKVYGNSKTVELSSSDDEELDNSASITIEKSHTKNKLSKVPAPPNKEEKEEPGNTSIPVDPQEVGEALDEELARSANASVSNGSPNPPFDNDDSSQEKIMTDERKNIMEKHANDANSESSSVLNDHEEVSQDGESRSTSKDRELATEAAALQKSDQADESNLSGAGDKDNSDDEPQGADSNSEKKLQKKKVNSKLPTTEVGIINPEDSNADTFSGEGSKKKYKELQRKPTAPGSNSGEDDVMKESRHTETKVTSPDHSSDEEASKKKFKQKKERIAKRSGKSGKDTKKEPSDSERKLTSPDNSSDEEDQRKSRQSRKKHASASSNSNADSDWEKDHKKSRHSSKHKKHRSDKSEASLTKEKNVKSEQSEAKVRKKKHSKKLRSRDEVSSVEDSSEDESSKDKKGKAKRKASRKELRKLEKKKERASKDISSDEDASDEKVCKTELQQEKTARDDPSMSDDENTKSKKFKKNKKATPNDIKEESSSDENEPKSKIARKQSSKPNRSSSSDSDSEDSKPLLKISKSRKTSGRREKPREESRNRSTKKEKRKRHDSTSSLDKEIERLSRAPKLKSSLKKDVAKSKLVVRLKKLNPAEIQKLTNKLPMVDGVHNMDDGSEDGNLSDGDQEQDYAVLPNAELEGDNRVEDQDESTLDSKSSESVTNVRAKEDTGTKKPKKTDKNTRKRQIEDLSSSDSNCPEEAGEPEPVPSEDSSVEDGFINNLMDDPIDGGITGHRQGESEDVVAMREDENAENAILRGDSISDSCESDLEMLENKSEQKQKEKTKKVRDSGASGDDDTDDFVEVIPKKKISDRLLVVNLDDSDEDMPLTKSKSKEKGSSSSLSSSSDDDQIKKTKRTKKRKKSSSENSDFFSSENKSKKKRSRIKKMASSNSDASNGEDKDSPSKQHKKIRRIIKDTNLSQEVQDAVKAEQQRRQRILDRQKKYNKMKEKVDLRDDVRVEELILEADPDDPTKALLEVDKNILKHLKPHQVNAVQFLWDSCVESLSRIKKEEGSGCILAHSMGLGKTLSVISFVHTLMSNFELTGVRTCLVVCPLNTILNWQNEFWKWIDDSDQFTMWELSSIKDNYVRCDVLKDWQDQGGIMIIGYEMYRNLTTHRTIRKAKLKKIITEALVSPGPDLVVCDEGHILKNAASALSTAMNNIRTRRRIVLTGTPLQNNLVEYHCMVDFVKPKLLGTKKEFCNRFVNPITNGQSKDATQFDVSLMKKRAHILHETLAGCVQRQDYSILKRSLGEKHEYVITIRLSELQIQLYEKYLAHCGRDEDSKMKSAQLFSDYQNLMRIWNHPYLLKLGDIRDQNKMRDDDESDFITDGSDASDMASFIASNSSEDEETKWCSDSDSDDAKKKKKTDKKEDKGSKLGKTRRSRRINNDVEEEEESSSDDETATKAETTSGKWWESLIDSKTRFDINLGGKILLLADILRMCEAIGDKVLVFSQSLLSLNCIEDFLRHWDNQVEEDPTKKQVAGSLGWIKDKDYFRMDGSTSAQLRKTWAEIFNKPENHEARLFLISTRAGCLGTNLVGGNRVIIFDASWNPSHDMQSMFRVYRFGQTKPVYIYRFLAQGTMEQKIYERQVTKQSLSQRVVDEHQIERHFTNADLRELYAFSPSHYDPEAPQETPTLPKDLLLADLLSEHPRWIVKYHEHDSLLEQQQGEDLTEEERKVAWQEFEDEKKHGIRRMAGMAAPRLNPGLQNQAWQQQLLTMQYQMIYQQCVAAEPDICTTENLQQFRTQLRTLNPQLSAQEVENYTAQFAQSARAERHQKIRERYAAMLKMEQQKMQAEQFKMRQAAGNQLQMHQGASNQLQMLANSGATSQAPTTQSSRSLLAPIVAPSQANPSVQPPSSNPNKPGTSKETK